MEEKDILFDIVWDLGHLSVVVCVIILLLSMLIPDIQTDRLMISSVIIGLIVHMILNNLYVIKESLTELEKKQNSYENER